MRIASLTVALGAELAGFRQGLATAVSDIKRFAQQMGQVKIANPLASATPVLNKPAMVVAAKNAVSALREAFDAEKVLLQQHAAQGLISPARFRVEGVRSAEAFNKGVLSEISKLDASGMLTPKLRADLVSKLEKIGHDSGTAFRQELEKSLAAAGESALARVGDRLRTAGRALTVAVTVPLGAVAAAGIKFAAEAQENFAVFERFFGGAAQRTTVALKQLTTIIPKTTDDLQKMATQVQAALLPMGILPDVAADMSVRLVRLAADMSILRRSTPEQELETIRSALLGNVRGLRSFNIALTDANIGAAAVALGFSKTGTELTAQQRALTIYAAILEKTASVQGLSEESSRRFSGQVKLMRAALQEAAETIGTVLLPALLPVVRTIADAARAFSALPDSVRKNIVIFGALAFALGPVLTIVGGLLVTLAKFVTVITVLKSLGLTLTAIGGMLAPGGIVIVGLTLLAVALGAMAVNAIKAAVETAKLKDELGKLSKTNLQLRADDLTLDLNRLLRLQTRLQEQFAEELRFNVRPNIDTVRGLAKVGTDIAAVRKELGLIAGIKAAPAITAVGDAAADAAALLNGASDGMDIFSQTLKTGKSALEQFVENSSRLVARFQELRAEGAPARAVATQLVAAFSQAETSVSKLGDRLDDDAVALRRVFAELRAVAGEALKVALAPQEPQRIQFTPTIDTSPQAINAMMAELQATGRTTFRLTISPTLDSSPAAVSGMVQDLVSSTSPAQRTIPFLASLKPPTDTELSNFTAQLDRLVQQKGLLDLAVLTGDKAFQKSAAAEFDAGYRRAIATLANLTQAVRASNIPIAAQILLLQKIAQIAGKIPAPFQAAVSSSAKFVTAGRGLTQIAAGFTNINKEVLTMVSSILDATAAVEQFKKAQKEKDALGQISGALGVAGAVVAFGAAADEFLFGSVRRANKELADTLKKNQESLDQLNVTLKGFRGTFGDQAALQRALTEALPEARALAAARPNFGLGFPDLTAIRAAQADFVAAMLATGFTMTELNEIAKGFGITLIDSSGRVIPQAVGQLVEHFEKARLAAFKFANTVEDVTLATRLRNAVAGTEQTPERIITDSITDLFKLAPEIAKRFFGSIDFSDGLSASELTEIRKQSQALVEAFLTGALDPALLLGFKTPQEFAQFMLTWIDSLNEMTKATDAVTRSLVNVPEGFKIDRARFQATIAEIATLKPGVVTPPWHPPLGSGTALPPGVVPAGGALPTIVLNGDVYVDAHQLPATEITDVISRELKRRAKSKGPLVPAAAALDL